MHIPGLHTVIGVHQERVASSRTYDATGVFGKRLSP